MHTLLYSIKDRISRFHKFIGRPQILGVILAFLAGGGIWLGLGASSDAARGVTALAGLANRLVAPQSTQETGRPAKPAREAAGGNLQLDQAQDPINQDPINRTEAKTDIIGFEDQSTAFPTGLVTLGARASRTQCKPLTKTGTNSPYTMTGTDSVTGASYTYPSNYNYGSSNSACPSGLGTCQLNEGKEYVSGLTSFTRAESESYLGRTGMKKIGSDGGSLPGSQATNNRCSSNSSGAITEVGVYRSVFGP